ncbi:aspartate aminotransferase family protein [Paraburkholderia hayleyella]|uniref:aspartate aminotransferase family protein n=1 Tax=Paraburkholderia hayleyella TaxID=2152889 RepID=UPI0012921214|nr:aspartate aminotransferase family protein [Paraburkholderia hayleyella]
MSVIEAREIRVAAAAAETAASLLARRAHLLGPAYRLFYERPLHPVRGEGVWLYDDEGRRYLDAYNNVAAVGHCHPRVVEAIARQAAQLNTHTRYLHTGILDYAERLLALLPAAGYQLMLTCTGSEANDLALRAARAFTGGTGVIVTECAYHGVTAAVAEVSPSLGMALGPMVRTVPAPGTGGALSFAGHVQAAIDDLQAHGVRPAALLVDTVFSSDGVRSHPCDALAGAAEAIRRAGGVLIADEVQAGFWRLGERMWGFERHGVVPDIVTMGKPMGNGHPVAGVALRAEIIASFGAAVRYFNTFGGNPVSCAAASAVLDVLEEEKLGENALYVGEHLHAGLRWLAGRHPLIAEVRGTGLFAGVELKAPEDASQPVAQLAARVVNGMREAGVLISATGVQGNVLKIRPPLPFSGEHADLLLDALDGALTLAVSAHA